MGTDLQMQCHSRSYCVYKSADTWKILETMQNGGMYLEICVRKDIKLVTVWLTNADRQNTTTAEQLKQLCAKCSAKKYTVAQFFSGTEDLYSNTRDLLLFNRRRTAELAVRREKQQTEVKLSGRQPHKTVIQC